MKINSLLSLAFLSLVAACGGSGNGAGSPSGSLAAGPVTPPAASPLRAESDYYDQVQQVHLAYFGAAADPVTQSFWAGKSNAAKLPIKLSELAIAYNTDANAKAYIDALANSKESQEIYRGSNEVFLNTLFKTVFSRVPSAEEQKQWLNQLDSGKLARQQAPVMILGNAPAGDTDLLKNKLVASREFSAAINTAELKNLFTSAPDALAVSRALLAAIPAQPANNALVPPVAKAAVKRFAQDVQLTALPLPAGSVRGYSGYLFRRSAAIMCQTIQGQARLADFQPLLDGQRKTKASDLALQEFQFHHTDCSDSEGIWRISFDAAGNATVTGSGVKLNYTAAEITGALNGTPIEDVVNRKKISFDAYGLPASFNSINTVLVQKVVMAGLPGESVTAWSQP